MRNKFYRAKSNGLDVGICAISKDHALEVLQKRIHDYGFDKLDGVSIKRDGNCDWDIGCSIIYGESK